MRFQSPFRFGLLVFGNLYMVRHTDLRDLDGLVDLFDIPLNGRGKVFGSGVNLAR